MEIELYQISRCRLHPDNDLYRDQEQHKIHVDVNEWQCGYCRKRFYEDKHHDRHFENISGHAYTRRQEARGKGERQEHKRYSANIL
jgi:hypothetical protein